MISRLTACNPADASSPNVPVLRRCADQLIMLSGIRNDIDNAYHGALDLRVVGIKPITRKAYVQPFPESIVLPCCHSSRLVTCIANSNSPSSASLGWYSRTFLATLSEPPSISETHWKVMQNALCSPNSPICTRRPLPNC